MDELMKIQEKLQNGEDHFTANEVILLINQLEILTQAILQDKRTQIEIDDRVMNNVGEELRTRNHLTLIQGGKA